MSKSLPYDKAAKVYDKVMKINPEEVGVVTTERIYHKELAGQVRAFLKKHGISSREVSVTSADGSMCCWIDIRLPRIDRGLSYREIEAMDPKDAQVWFEESKVMEEHRDKANRNLKSVIAAAFPGCADRSDVQIDYFDFLYTIH